MAAKKSTGISAVYGSVTGTVVTAFDSVNTLSSAAKMLAKNAETQAMISRIESSNSLLEAMGVSTNEMSAVDRISQSAQLMEALRNL